jgi:hypothetical protein
MGRRKRYTPEEKVKILTPNSAKIRVPITQLIIW